MSTENVIGTNVMRLRTSKGISQKALAERAQLSRLGLAKIEQDLALVRGRFWCGDHSFGLSQNFWFSLLMLALTGAFDNVINTWEHGHPPRHLADGHAQPDAGPSPSRLRHLRRFFQRDRTALSPGWWPISLSRGAEILRISLMDTRSSPSSAVASARCWSSPLRRSGRAFFPR